MSGVAIARREDSSDLDLELRRELTANLLYKTHRIGGWTKDGVPTEGAEEDAFNCVKKFHSITGRVPLEPDLHAGYPFSASTATRTRKRDKCAGSGIKDVIRWWQSELMPETDMFSRQEKIAKVRQVLLALPEFSLLSLVDLRDLMSFVGDRMLEVARKVDEGNVGATRPEA